MPHFQGQSTLQQNSDLIFAKILPGRPVRPYIYGQLALTAKMAHFEGQTIPRAEFRPDFCQNFTWTSVKALHMDPVIPHGQNGPFSRSNDSYSRILTSFLPKFYLDACYDLIYGTSWPSRPKWPIFMVKRALEQNFDLIFAKILRGRPFRPYLWS
ncbi:hypothetical protein KY289_022881 [Solanum tuberosum]|nr:hypothetical protein KY289_022881 [Solanum tuberosum]